jgi:DNA mismatch repair ATPase MutS
MVLLSIQPCSAALYQLIAQENLKSLASQPYQQLSINPNQQYFELYHDELKRQLNPLKEVKRRFAFKLAESQEQPSSEQLILDVTSWQDLELLSGPKSDPTQYLGAQLDRTNTELGRISFFKKLVVLCNDISKLTQQQQFIKTITEEKELYDSLMQQFKELNVDENVLFSLWDDELFYSTMQRDFKIVSFSETLNSYLTTIPSFNEYIEKTQYLAEGGMAVTAGVGFVTLMLYAMAASQSSPYAADLKSFNKKIGLDSLGKFNPAGQLFNLLKSFNKDNRKQQLFAKFFILVISATGALEWFAYCKNNIKSRMVFSSCLETKLAHVAHYISTVENIIDTFEHHPCCEQFDAIHRLKEEFSRLVYTFDELKSLLKILSQTPFDDGSYHIYKGHIYAAYKLLHMHKDKFINLMMALGEIDAHIGIATLYKEFENKEQRFCFAEYIQDDQPALYLEEFWNPMIRAQIVTNNYVAGKRFSEKQHMIISGPNAGGKSTAMKSIILNIILSLGLTIAPGKRCIVPPFSKVMTYLNITDDLIARKSRYKAGLLRARDLIETVKHEQSKHFTFTSVDEAFDGTNFKISQAAAYTLIKRLCSYPLNMCVACSHFPLIPTLETPHNNIANYKVSVREDQGPINYPFKLEKGISHQIVAVKMLEQEGFDAEFMNQLQEILAKT